MSFDSPTDPVDSSKSQKKRKSESLTAEEREAKKARKLARKAAKATAAPDNAYCTENEISYEPVDAASAMPPVTDFSALEIDENLRKGLEGFTKPTPVQASSWPCLFAGRDAIGIAETG